MTHHVFSRHAHLKLPLIRQMKEVVADIQTSEAEPNNGQTRWCEIVPRVKLHGVASDLPCSPLPEKKLRQDLQCELFFA